MEKGSPTTSPKSREERQYEADIAYLEALNQDDWAYGTEIFYFMGIRVIEHTKPEGTILALKVKPPQMLKRSEAAMMHYAASNGVLAPKVHGCYDIVMKNPSKPEA